jgi:3-dehydroquinate dehydratase
VLADISRARIMGFGVEGYLLALRGAVAWLDSGGGLS